MSDVEKFTGQKIKALQSDNCREYCNYQFYKFLREHGIRILLAIPYVPQQNGIAERKNRTLLAIVRYMMRQSGAPIQFWAEAIFNANYTKNICPTH